jgi:hypothetical protein
LYNDTPIEKVLRLELLNGTQVVGKCWYAMNFAGWRALGAPYPQVMLNPGQQVVTGFRLIAPENVEFGRVYVDYVNPKWDGVLLPDDQQPWVNPDAGKPDGPWMLNTKELLASSNPEHYIHSPVDIAYKRPWLAKRQPPEKISEQERQDLETLRKRLPMDAALPAGANDPVALQACREALKLRRKGALLTGVPLASRFNSPPDGIPAGPLFSRAAAAYLGAKAAGRTQEAADLLQLLKELCIHFQEQGLAWGSYSGPVGPNAESLLSVAGDLDWTSYLRGPYLAALWNGPLAEVLVSEDLTAPATGQRGQWNNTDHFFYIFHRLPPYLLAMPDLTDRLQFMRAWQAFIDRLCDDSMGEPFAPDGTIHHHQQQHVSYGTQLLFRLFPILEMMRDTLFRPSPAALATLKNVLTTAAYESDRSGFCVPPSLPGYPGCPHSFAQGAYTLKDWALILARHGSPDGKQAVDPEMASLYLALATQPDDPVATEFAALGLKPTVFGHRTLNGAGAALHRRDYWLVCVMGYAAGRRGAEWNNAYMGSGYSRYMRNGSAFVISSGDPVSFWDSGFQFEGYDWRFVPGATSRVTPPQATMDFDTGGVTGGTSLDRDGIWGGRFWGAMEFQKSAFCFGNRVTVITSGIRQGKNETNLFPLVTTLFQNSFARGTGTNRTTAAPAAESCWADGMKTKKFPAEHVLSGQQGHWLVDNRQTGYYVHPSPATIHLARRDQAWTYCFQSLYLKPGKPRDGNPDNYNATTGAYALAWLDHGANPEATECVYTLIPRTTPEAMKDLARDMSDPSNPPYQVLQKDAQAHILRDRDTRTTGYVIFHTAWRPSEIRNPKSELLAINRPCSIMLREGEKDALHLSVACTDIKEWGWGTRPVVEGDIALTLAGAWNLDGQQGCSVQSEDGKTVLRIPFKDFMPVRLDLMPVQPGAGS